MRLGSAALQTTRSNHVGRHGKFSLYAVSKYVPNMFIVSAGSECVEAGIFMQS